MKQYILPFLVAACMLTACNNNKKTSQETTTSEDSLKNNQVPKMDIASDEMRKQSEELQKLPPLTLDQLKALLPEELMGAKRSNYQATSATGTGLANAEYKLNDSTEIDVSIWDCGGPAGAGIYNMQYLGMMNYQSETEDEYTKTIDFKGQKALEHCQKSNNRCSLTYFGGGRFLVTLQGQNVHPDGLKQAAGELNLKS